MRYGNLKIPPVGRSIRGDRAAREKPEDEGFDTVFHYNLDSGALRGRYPLADTSVPHQLNDIVVSREGEVWVTDTLHPAVY